MVVWEIISYNNRHLTLTIALESKTPKCCVGLPDFKASLSVRLLKILNKVRNRRTSFCVFDYNTAHIDLMLSAHYIQKSVDWYKQ